MADPVPVVAPQPPSPPSPGLLNSGPGVATTTPGTSPPGSGSGAPVTGYQPAAATAAVADSTGYTAQPFTVSDNAKVASQLNDIIKSGSPLMQEAEANARNLTNSRGLLNSGLAVQAGQKAVLDAATPIATADAATYDRAATNTTTAANTAAQFGAGAKNTALLQNAAADTSTSQFNAGQTDTALNSAATASNALEVANQQIVGTKDVAELQATTQKVLAGIQQDTTLSATEKQNASAQAIASQQAATTASVAALQAQTTLTAQDKAAAATAALAATNNTAAFAIANLQADASLSIADKQAATARIVASINSDTSKAVQQLQNAGSLANIRANGDISTKLQVLGDNNKVLLQNNSGAATIYNQMLTNMAQIQLSPDMTADQKAQALNNQVTTLSDALGVMSSIAGTPGVSSLLNFTSVGANPEGGFGGPQAGPVLPAGTPPAVQNAAAQAAPAIQNLYASVLGRPADAAGLAYWAGQAANGMPIAQIQASMMASTEYQSLHPAS